MTLYDTIGRDYARRRREDPRIAAQIHEALGAARTVLNVGAGAGSYEPRDRPVIAVEPSTVMIRQRPSAAAPVVRASAMDLPFRDASFDATLSVLTLHHWPDVARGLRALRRVARERVVILTFDVDATDFWLMDYFPEILEIDRRTMPALSSIEQQLGAVEVSPVPVPHDCKDGFLGANWRKPQAYLDPEVRAATSVFARIGGLDAGLARLRDDLDSGVWHERYGHLEGRSELDIGYRLVVWRRRAADAEESRQRRQA